MGASAPNRSPRLVLAERLIEGGQLEAAAQAIDADELDHPSDPHAAALRAEIALLRRDYAVAQTGFADLCANPDADAVELARAHTGLGAAQYALGNISAAVDTLEIAVEGGGRSTRAWLTLAQALFALGRHEDLTGLATRARSTGDLDVLTARAVAMIAGVDAYMRDQIDVAQRFVAPEDQAALTDESNQLGLEAYRRMVEAGIGGRIMPERRALQAALGYQHYLLELLDSRAANPALYTDGPAARLHVIGDSHTLSPAHTRVSLDRTDHRVVPHTVIGAKAWHLAPDINPIVTPQRTAFERLVDRLPHGEPIIAMFGEIDCRASEGLFPYLNAHPDQDREQFCRALAKSYVAYLSTTLAGNDRRVMVCGVPAPHPVQAHKLGEGSRQFIDLVGFFNTCLGDATRHAGMIFLDPHQLTAADDGVANGDLHLDTVHLKPAVFQTLLAKSEVPAT
jgi:tetratricopeptide (TPR) repeat protein